MTQEDVLETIKEVPVGGKLQLIKQNGEIAEVWLASHEITSYEKKDYGTIEVPEMPPALIVRNTSRFGNFRVEINEIVSIAWIG